MEGGGGISILVSGAVISSTWLVNGVSTVSRVTNLFNLLVLNFELFSNVRFLFLVILLTVTYPSKNEVFCLAKKIHMYVHNGIAQNSAVITLSRLIPKVNVNITKVSPETIKVHRLQLIVSREL